MEKLIYHILEHSLNEVYIFDADSYKFIYMNEAALKNIGYEKDEIKNLTPLDIKPDFTPEKLDSLVAPLKNGTKEKIAFHTFHRRKNGTTYPVMVSLTKSSYNEKDIFVAFMFDESDLYREKEKFEKIFRFHKATMMLIDPDTGEIIDANESAQRFYGYSINELKRMKIQDINMLSEEQVKDEMKRAESEARNYFNFKHRLKNGKIKDVEVYSSPIPYGDRKILFSIIHDVTEKIKLLKIINEEQKLDAVGVLAAGIAHNFNNIFTGIYGYINMIEDLTDNENAKKAIAKLWKVVRKAEDITSRLITFSKGGDPIFETQNLNIFLLKIIQEFQEKYDIDISFIVKQDVGELQFEKRQIKTAIEEIISNAVDFANGSAKVEITVDFADFSEVENILPKGRYAKIVIRDFGKGISPDIIDRIFEAFFTTNPLGKLGLGLPVAYSILKNHGGTLKVKSNPDEGSEFSLYLPS